jgi:hypothetical protein
MFVVIREVTRTCLWQLDLMTVRIGKNIKFEDYRFICLFLSIILILTDNDSLDGGRFEL